MGRRLGYVIAAAAVLAAPAQAGAGTAGEQDCSQLLAPRQPVEQQVPVGGQTVVVRDPYGGLVSRNRLFVAFGVRYPNPEARAAVASIQWLLDGAPAPGRGGPPNQLQFQSTRLTPGNHVISAVLTPTAGGAPVTAQIPITATDCQQVRIFPSLVNGRTTQPAELQITGGGPPLETVALRANGLRAAVPASRRGRSVGTLVLRGLDPGGDIDEALRRYTLRAPRQVRRGARSVVLLRQSGLVVTLRPGRTGTLLSIRGLPDDTPALELDLRRGVLSVASACPVPTVTARLTGGDGPAATVTSGIDISRNC